MDTPAIGGRYLTGNFAPIWTESDAYWLPVTGELPKGLEGTLFRNGPNPQFWPTSPHHHWFGGDGMIHAFTIEKGRVRYRNRWVRTPKWQAENAAGHPLFDPFGPPDPNVANSDGCLDCVANTNMIAHAGRLLALEEAHLPVELDRRFNSEVQQRCIDDMAEHRGWGKGRGQGRKSPAAMRA